MNSRFFIRGLGHQVPEEVLTNEDLEKFVETSDEWITTRTGIRQRHIARDGETCSTLAAGASRKALAEAGLDAEALSHIFLATFTADYPIPSGACTLENALGIRGRMAVDVSAACSGFLYALDMSRGALAMHPDATVLCAASEIVTSRVNFSDRSTCVLFGDGAGACVVSSQQDGALAEVVDVMLSSDGALGELLTVKGGGSAQTYAAGETVGEEYFVQMQGREIYKHAVRSMTEISKAVLKKNGLGIEDVDVLVPHQANLRIIEAVGKKLGIAKEKVFVNVEKYGNTSAASVPIALSEAVQSGFIGKGQLVLITTFGGGFTWGSALVRF